MREQACSTSAAGRARSPSTSRGGCGPARSIGIDASSRIVVDRADGLAASEGVSNVEFRVGDAYALDFDDDTFDVVHAHQVLQHLAPTRSTRMREFRRVLKPGGIVAVRDVDYGGVIWSPARPGSPGGSSSTTTCTTGTAESPTPVATSRAGRARRGSTTSRRAAATWVFSTALEREWWGGSWAERATESSSPRTRSNRVTPARRAAARSPLRGASGRPTKTAGSSCRTARSSLGPDRGP